MNGNEWNIYLKMIKELQDFQACKVYLQDKFDLLEKASTTLKRSFSIDQMLLVYNDERQLKTIFLDQRQGFMRTVFEIYFGYAKNLLVNFDIYSEKTIKEDTPQIVNYLAKFPNYSYHLFTLGYEHKKSTTEWIFSEAKLTKERRDVLVMITICCCLGYSYLDEPLKFLSLTIFEYRRISLINIMEKFVCEYCNFQLVETEFCCSVCNQSVDKMSFYKQWETNLPYNIESNGTLNGDAPCQIDNGLSVDSWQCSSCTFLNDKNCSTCNACFSVRLNRNDVWNKEGNVEVAVKVDINETVRGKRVDTTESRDRNNTFSSLPNTSVMTWTCDLCTFNNELSSSACSVCYTVNPRNNPYVSLDQKRDQREHYGKRIVSPEIIEIVKSYWQCQTCGAVNNENGVCIQCRFGDVDNDNVIDNRSQERNNNAYVAIPMADNYHNAHSQVADLWYHIWQTIYRACRHLIDKFHNRNYNDT